MNDLVAVLLLNYNQNDYTIKCVDSLLKSDYNNYKIILVDNGSTTENVKELERNLPKHEKLIFNKIKDNIGFTMGYNYALEEGTKLNPGYFLLMNNDTIIDKSAIFELVETCKRFDNKARVTGKVYHYDEPKVLQEVGYTIGKKHLKFNVLGFDELDTGQYEEEVEREMIDDIFVIQPAKLYDEIGGYSPYFWINAVEKDLSLRAISKGYKLAYTPKAKLWHKGSVSIGGRDKNPKVAYWNIQSSLILRYIHLNKRSFALFYLKICNSVLRTNVKSIYLKLFKNTDIRNYAKAKYAGLVYFNKWVFNKRNNDGNTPY